jgi:hypothetical protein
VTEDLTDVTPVRRSGSTMGPSSDAAAPMPRPPASAEITWDTLPERSWPENARPTPEQLADWMGTLSRDELVWYLGQHQWMRERQIDCFMRNHERQIAGLTVERDALRLRAGAAAEQWAAPGGYDGRSTLVPTKGLRTIHRYSLSHGTTTIEVPADYTFLGTAVRSGDGTPSVWLEVPWGAPRDHKLRLTFIGTGHPVPERGTHLGTAPVPNSPLIWHVYRAEP